MVQPGYDPGNPYGDSAGRPRVRGWVWSVPLLLGVAAGTYWLLPEQTKDTVAQVEEHVSAWTPSWQPANYTPEPVLPSKAETNHTNERIDALMAMVEAQQKELETLRKRPAGQATGQQGTRTPRKHGTALWIEHPPEEKPAEGKPLYWLGAGTWIPCHVEPRINSDVPGYFTVKTRTAMYDTETGRRLLIKQNQSIVAKDESADLLFGNTRIPTFALTLGNPDGSSVDLGAMPITDQLGTNGLTGKVDHHWWRLVWTSIFIGGLRGGQQAIQAGVTPGDPTGSVTSGVTGQFGQTATQRLGRAQDLRPTIEVESGSLCNILLTKAIELPEISR